MAAGRDLHGKRDRHEILSNFEWLHVIPFRTEHGFIAGELEADVHQSESANQDSVNPFTADILVTAAATDIRVTV